MRFLLLLLLSLFFCSPTAPIEGQICWEDVQGTTWYIDEQLTSVSSCRTEFLFGKDVVYNIKIYSNTSETGTSYIYMKGTVFNKRYSDNDGEALLFFTWARKHYAENTFVTPIEGYNIVDNWFLYKIDNTGHLLMGQGNPSDKNVYYWVFTRL
jgi:hypothetical protein